ncbi:MAG: signal recognition particle protein [Firmicutes bacterium]|nr:signal recognition particle protein [Bacillota bacterium]
MAFEGISSKLQDVFKKLRSKGVLTEKDVKDALREVKLALLEADVNFKVVKDFVKTVESRATGQDVLASLTPGQQVIKIVNDELIHLLGDEENTTIHYSSKPPTVIMLLGLQGAGKTTMAAKLAGYLKKQGKKPLLVACDIYRPAAAKQLRIVGESVGVPVFDLGTNVDPVEIARRGVQYASENDCGIVILDTAGRLHVDEVMMDEICRIRDNTHPSETLLVVDAMTGQDAVTVARQFDEMVEITGVILTKLDGDTRGGAAISIRAVTGKPIKFAGVGEKVTDIEPFYPDRMASRILGMGDVLSMIEKAQEAFDQDMAEKMTQRMMSNDFNLEDYLDQLKSVQKMGNMSDLLQMIPGMSGKIKDTDIDEGAFKRVEAMINSMTPRERRNPQLLDASRKRRIVRGAGVTIQELNQMLKQFEQGKSMMKQMTGMVKGKGKRKRFGGFGGFGGLGGGKNPFGF